MNHENNVGKNTRQFNNIKLSFMISYIVCKESCECGCHFFPGKTNTFISTDHCILNRIFNGVKRFSTEIN
ncbi:MAG: hypothetical protein MJ252_07540 [archaeon]|nr:hypothetical protein [archaeon]